MDATTAAIRDALLAKGACPATALFLATEYVADASRHIKRERDANLAQQLLPLGRRVAAEQIGCSENHVYKLVRRAKKLLSTSPQMDDSPA